MGWTTTCTSPQKLMKMAIDSQPLCLHIMQKAPDVGNSNGTAGLHRVLLKDLHLLYRQPLHRELVDCWFRCAARDVPRNILGGLPCLEPDCLPRVRPPRQ